MVVKSQQSIPNWRLNKARNNNLLLIIVVQSKLKPSFSYFKGENLKNMINLIKPDFSEMS